MCPLIVVKVIFEDKTEDIKIKDGIKIIDLLKQLDKNPEDYLTVLNGEVVTELEVLKDEDVLKLVRVWSGG